MAEAPPLVYPEHCQGEVSTDPSKVDVPSLIDGLANTFLKAIHGIREAGLTDEQRAAVTTDVVRQITTLRANVNVAKARETTTRLLKPLSQVPVTPFGVHFNIGTIRLYGLTPYDGSTKDPAEISRWITRVLDEAQAGQLTFEATIRLMARASAGSVSDYINQMRVEGKTLQEIVEQLEMRYGNLVLPEEARAECNKMQRAEGSNLSTFIDRLRHTANIACRYIDNQEERIRAIETLVESNIVRALPESVKQRVKDKMESRRMTFLPPLTSREIEKLCLDLERERQDRRQAVAKQRAGAVHRRNQPIYAVAEDLSDPELSSPDLSEEDEGESMIFLANQLAREKKKYTSKGLPINKDKVMKGALRKFNDKYHAKPTRPRNVAEVAYQGAPQGAPVAATPTAPPTKLDPGAVRMPIQELLDLAKCQRGQCIQCGQQGHLMRRDACPLKDKPLVNTPCVKCGRGLHSADDCVQPFMMRVNLAAEESLNEQ